MRGCGNSAWWRSGDMNVGSSNSDGLVAGWVLVYVVGVVVVVGWWCVYVAWVMVAVLWCVYVVG